MSDESDAKGRAVAEIMQALSPFGSEDVPSVILRALERWSIERDGVREGPLRAVCFELIKDLDNRIKST